MTKETEAKWAERVREWRASGLSAEEFAASRGFKASTLSWAASLLRGATPSPASTAASTEPEPQPRAKRRAASRRKAPQFLPVRTRATAATATTEMVVEIGSVRVRVSRGFDVSLLGDVVRAIAGSGR
jgi:hypothetical protein